MRNMTSRIAFACLLAGAPALGFAQTTTEPAATDDTMQTEAPVEGQIILQSEDSILAKDLLGTKVYSTADESIGDINDMIISLDGTVEGVVIGVGGFLGIGEKEVAVEMGKLVVTTSESGNVRLVLNATREELDAAPVFKSAVDQKMDEEAARIQNEAETGIATTTGSN